MFKKYLNKIKHNEGSISLGAVLAIPAILLVVFLMIDYLHIASDKANLQRRVDAAVLGMVAEAMPGENVTVDIDGTITSGTNAGKKVCEITTDIVNRGIERLRKDAYDARIDLDGIVNLSDEDQMKSGIAKIEARGYSDDLLISAFIPNAHFSYIVEGYASCNIKVIE